MKPHAQLWIKPKRDYFIPNDCVVIMRMTPCLPIPCWRPVSIKICSHGDMQFRYEQEVKYMENIRLTPAVLVVSVHENKYTDDCELCVDAVKREDWLGNISWRKTYRYIVETIRSEYPANVAGYDGPETLG